MPLLNYKIFLTVSRSLLTNWRLFTRAQAIEIRRSNYSDKLPISEIG